MKQPPSSLDELVLSDSAKSIQQQLTKVIQQQINLSAGKIKFSEFVRQVLYTPSLGYYQNELQPFGELGDFVTAPEMGKLFAACVANSIASLFCATEDFDTILEVGAGTGALAAEMLTVLAEKRALPKQYLILEPSASLQQIQKERIQKCHPNIVEIVTWVGQLPSAFDGLIIANEVVDAIPFERATCIEQQWQGLGVTVEQQGFTNCLLGPIDLKTLPAEMNELMQTGQVVEGYTTEYRPQAKAWIQSLSNSLRSGAILLLDYGYSGNELYHPQRASGTLSCFIRHHHHDDPFRYIGLQDITAHVDFTQIARTAVETGMQVSGFTTQAAFLLENGITEMAEEQSKLLAAEQGYQLSQQMQKLLMPGQMGEVIKAILLTKPRNAMNFVGDHIKGFSLQDHLHRL